MTALIQLWHERARPKPTLRDFDVQLGCHLEEFCEMLDALQMDSPRLGTLRVVAGNLAHDLKTGKTVAAISDRKGLLDSLADQIVTAVGIGHCAGMKTAEAVRRVNTSNWSKFDTDGQPIRDANGKIAKGPAYQAPDLEGLY